MRIALAVTQESVVSLVASVYDVFRHSIRSRPDGGAAADVLYAVTAGSGDDWRRRFSFIERVDTALSQRPDWVFVPALQITQPWMPDAYRPLVQWLRRVSAHGARIASVGTGSFLLAEAGLLEGRAAVTYSHFTDYFRRRYPGLDLRNDLGWVRDERLWCSGDLPWQELVLAMVAEIWGAKVAQSAAETYALHWTHSLFPPQRPEVIDACVSVAQRWLSEHHAEDNLIPRCLELVGQPRRTFNRRFRQQAGMTPTDYVQWVRVQNSQDLLAFTDLSVEEICYRVGYSDVGAFYRLFRRHTGLSPACFRRSRATAPLRQRATG